MNRAGIETWLMHLLRRQDLSRLQFELLLNSPPGSDDYEQELIELGIPVHRCPPTKQFPAYLWCLWQTFRQGQYDVVHSHVHHFSGLVLLVAWLAGVPGRLAHSHYDSRSEDRRGRLPRQVYRRGMAALIGRLATAGVAVSETAAAALFGQNWSGQSRYQVIPLGLPTELYAATHDLSGLRREFGFTDETLVFGHVGGFRVEKNHIFLLQVFAEVVQRQPHARLLLVGEGELLEPVREQARQLGVLDAVIFAGSRGDVPEVLQVMTVFLWPSQAEGLGLALIEAQMTGLPCIVAQHLPNEAHLPGSDLSLLPLSAGPAAWAKAALAAAQRPRRFPAGHHYDLQQSKTRFMEVYERSRR